MIQEFLGGLMADPITGPLTLTFAALMARMKGLPRRRSASVSGAGFSFATFFSFRCALCAVRQRVVAMPPSTGIVAPVTYAPARDAR